MGAFGAVETKAAAEYLRRAAGSLSHAWIFTGGTPDELLALARYAAAALECQARENRPCGICPDCGKILRDTHPDVITVRDDEHKTISADVIRAIRADAWIRPNEGARKVYIFPDGGRLTERDQNILLKSVEEGPPYAAFLFCAENGAAILPTLRSRCAELRLNNINNNNNNLDAARGGDIDQDIIDTAMDLCRRIVKRQGKIAELAARLEKKRVTREILADILNICYQALGTALLLLYNYNNYNNLEKELLLNQDDQEIADLIVKNLSPREIMSAAEILKKYRGECALQTGVNHILGALASELEAIR